MDRSPARWPRRLRIFRVAGEAFAALGMAASMLAIVAVVVLA